DDLIALSLCEHSIITGGTFGWWTGYLANGKVIHDKVYPSGCQRPEYYYPPCDDKSYCKSLFRNRSIVFLTPELVSIGDDLVTLSLCEHSTITGGTFG
ncbi:unnamed protein product, partial [Rotaria sp. Silwood1]